MLKYNGSNEQPVYLAVKGKVYDVTSGKNFYGPGGPYQNFAGRDATRGLACQSFDEEMLTKNLDGPLDPCDNLNDEQRENLRGWTERFDEKVRCSSHAFSFFCPLNLFSPLSASFRFRPPSRRKFNQNNRNSDCASPPIYSGEPLYFSISSSVNWSRSVPNRTRLAEKRYRNGTGN